MANFYQKYDLFSRNVKINNQKYLNRPIKKVLFWNNFYDMYAEGHSWTKQLQQFFLLLKLFDHAEVHLCEENQFNYNNVIVDEKIIKWFSSLTVFSNILNSSFLDYDMIICSIQNELKLADRLHEQFKISDVQDLTNPLIYSLPDILGKTQTQIESVKCYLNKNSRIKSKAKIDKVSRMKQRLKDTFVIWDRLKEEINHEAILKSFIKFNELNSRQSYEKILVLDDFNRRFYLGDSFFWLKHIRENIEILTENGEISIVCNYPQRFYRLQELYQVSFGDSVRITTKLWSNINFSSYNLILCHADTIGKFLSHCRNHNNIVESLSKSCIFFINRDYVDVNDVYGWSYIKLLNKIKKKGFAENFKKLKKQVYNELTVTQQQIQFGNRWLAKKGVVKNDVLIALPHDSSGVDKVLPFIVFSDMVKYLFRFKNVKILLFDFKSEGLKTKIIDSIGLFYFDRIISISAMSTNQELGILSNKQIKLIISPCTGITHLANGIYTYLRNKNLREKNSVPKIVVYTGIGVGKEYHPKTWWKNTPVNCFSYLLKDKKKQLIIMKKCPNTIDEYQQVALSLKDIPSQLFIEFLRRISFSINLKFIVQHENRS